MSSLHVVNINTPIRVKLTETGSVVFTEYQKSNPDEYLPFCDNEGLYNMNLWEAMKIFGSSMNDGQDPVFENNTFLIII
jgi:hypothetical protein